MRVFALSCAIDCYSVDQMEAEEEIEALKAILSEENVFFDSVSRIVSVHYADMLDGLQIVYTLPGTVSTTGVDTCARNAYTCSLSALECS